MPLYTGTFTFRDGAGVTSVMQLHIVDATPADAQTNFVSIAGALDAITGGAIVGLDMTIPVDLATEAPGLQAVPDAASDVEVGARFIFQVEGGFSHYFTVPTFNENAFAAPEGPLLVNEPEIQAIITTLIGPEGWSDRRQADIASYKTGYKTFGGKPKRSP